MSAIYFTSPDELRQWLLENHDKTSEVLIGFYKKSASTKGITYNEALDECLCFGWIDGVRKGVDAERYTIRWTPRKTRSIWSAVNLKRIVELIDMGRVQPSGLKTYEERDQRMQGIYSHENPDQPLNADYETRFRENASAWELFLSKPPSYQKAARHWVMTAKQEATRLKRLNELIDYSAKGEKVPPLRRPGE
ncbi:MAG: YdeI/OmpD-associated family protein [Anaerolineae bacterium]|nr:YdeI/OmpD-associated family protein [Anaerolineae bacterium]